MTRAAGPLAVGGVAGLAWAAGLRGLMVEVAGKESAVHWYGTFVQILLPGVVAGMAFGWAWHTRHRRWWLVAAPLAFPIAVIVSPDMVATIAAGEIPFSDGLGGGALALPLFGMAGGYAIAGRVRWGRVVCGLFALVPIPAWTFSASTISPDLSLATARGAWVSALFFSSIAVLAFGCAIPIAASEPRTPTANEAAEADFGAVASVPTTDLRDEAGNR